MDRAEVSALDQLYLKGGLGAAGPVARRDEGA
jgi:hypothetical protein